MKSTAEQATSSWAVRPIRGGHADVWHATLSTRLTDRRGWLVTRFLLSGCGRGWWRCG
jgi:hypothetical protein